MRMTENNTMSNMCMTLNMHGVLGHGEEITIRLKLEKSSIQHTDGLGKSFPLLS